MSGTGDRFELVTRNTEEVVGDSEVDELLKQDEQPKGYIGFAPTSAPHIGHMTTLRKVADFLEAGFEFDILIADEHALLDTEKTEDELVDARSEYYEKAMEGMIAASGVEPEDVSLVRGSSFQNDEDYVRMQRRLSTKVPVSQAKSATGDVVEEGDGMKLSHLDYVVMQSVDVPALDADLAFGGIDQRGIYMVGRDYLPSIGEEKPTCIFSPLLTGLQGGKMSSSDVESKIGLADDREAVEEKMQKAWCPEEQVENNGVIEYTKHLVFPVLEKWGEDFTVERPDEYGGDTSYQSFDELRRHYLGEEDFLEERGYDSPLHPEDLKTATGNYIARLTEKAREEADIDRELAERAFPEEFS